MLAEKKAILMIKTKSQLIDDFDSEIKKTAEEIQKLSDELYAVRNKLTESSKQLASADESLKFSRLKEMKIKTVLKAMAFIRYPNFPMYPDGEIGNPEYNGQTLNTTEEHPEDLLAIGHLYRLINEEGPCRDRSEDIFSCFRR